MTEKSTGDEAKLSEAKGFQRAMQVMDKGLDDLRKTAVRATARNNFYAAVQEIGVPQEMSVTVEVAIERAYRAGLAEGKARALREMSAQAMCNHGHEAMRREAATMHMRGK